VIFALREDNDFPTLCFIVVQVCNIDKMNTQSDYITYVLVQSYMQCNMYTSVKITTTQE